MPAKPLTIQQVADATRLKAFFKEWQAIRATEKQEWSQDAAAALLGFGQSAMNQYLNAKIPLNPDAARKFAGMLARPIRDFSPSIADEIDALAAGNTQGKQHQGGGDEQGFLDKAVSAPAAGEPAIYVPLLSSSASMGPGSDLNHEEVVIGRMTLSPSWVSKTIKPTSLSNLRFIHGYGDSMDPTFKDGDVLLVDTGVKETKVDAVYVLEANDRLYIKRVRQRIDGAYEISSDNQNVKTVDVLNGETQVTVKGRVVWVWNGRKI